MGALSRQPETCHYFFVDEAGDFSLFDRKGQVLVGREGVSKTIMVGFARLGDPAQAEKVLGDLRASLLADPYFLGVPSMQPQARKTALAFHAKDDLPEVRREVFQAMRALEIQIQVIVRRKAELAAEAQMLYQLQGIKVTPNEIYDDLTKRIFRNVLHAADRNEVTFAHRTSKERDRALMAALEQAQNNFALKGARPTPRPLLVRSAYPSQAAGLQIVDYHLWALQRMIERGEERYFAAIAERFELVLDLDDKRQQPFGEYYTQNNLLNLQKFKPL